MKSSSFKKRYREITGWLQIARKTATSSLAEANLSLTQFSLSSGNLHWNDCAREIYRTAIFQCQLVEHFMELLLFSAFPLSPLPPLPFQNFSWRLRTSELISKKLASLLPVNFYPTSLPFPNMAEILDTIVRGFISYNISIPASDWMFLEFLNFLGRSGNCGA